MNPRPDLLAGAPLIPAPLDPSFCPISAANRRYQAALKSDGRGVPLALAIERHDGLTTVHRTEVFPGGSVHDDATRIYVERLAKFLLWQVGGWRLTVAGSPELGAYLRGIYSPNGNRAFDVQIMERVYERPFVVDTCSFEHSPSARESSSALGGHLDGCRIGFDLGASDYKIAAVQNGEAAFTTEIPWDPRMEKDPEWHYRKINEGLRLAAGHLPQVDAIGGSAAGIYIDNQAMVASLFRSVPADQFAAKVKPLFLRLQREWQVPLEVANDGDVTALAGAMSLGVTGVLGLAMGSSQAVGFLDQAGRITGWLNELAFAPVDYNPGAAADEWSGDTGCGVQYFSQQAVVKLAPAAGIKLPAGHPAEQLKHVQDLHQKGDARPEKIFRTIGVYLGYALAHYADFYDCGHVLVLGRVTSGAGGDLIVEQARGVLAREFPSVGSRISIHLPDEKSKRLGQAVAAASLPALRR